MNMFMSFKMGTFSNPGHTHPGILILESPPPPPPPRIRHSSFTFSIFCHKRPPLAETPRNTRVRRDSSSYDVLQLLRICLSYTSKVLYEIVHCRFFYLCIPLGFELNKLVLLLSTDLDKQSPVESTICEDPLPKNWKPKTT